MFSAEKGACSFHPGWLNSVIGSFAFLLHFLMFKRQKSRESSKGVRSASVLNDARLGRVTPSPPSVSLSPEQGGPRLPRQLATGVRWLMLVKHF